MSEEAPIWLNETKESAPESSRGSSLMAALTPDKRSTIFYWVLKVITMGLCVMMSATACIGLTMLSGIDDVGKIFIAVFMFFFALLLFSFESVQIWPCEFVDHFYQRNFGFLYTAKGKAFYIIFIAFLNFGLKEPSGLCIATGVCLCIFGVAEVVIYLKYPELYNE